MVHQPSVNSENYNAKHARTRDRLCKLLEGLILTKHPPPPVQKAFYRACIYSTAKSILKVSAMEYFWTLRGYSVTNGRKVLSWASGSAFCLVLIAMQARVVPANYRWVPHEQEKHVFVKSLLTILCAPNRVL